MIQINLKKLLARKEIAPIVNVFIEAIATTVAVVNAEGDLVLGIAPEPDAERFPIEIDGEIIGWAIGTAKAQTLVPMLSYIVSREVEKKQLAAEVLNKYKEINLFYQLSEKITASLELEVVGELIIEEARKLIRTTSGSVMLLNPDTGKLEIASSFGSAAHTNFTVTPGVGIAGCVFSTGKGEIVNDVLTDLRFVPGKNRVSSIICAPLKTRDKVIGVVNFSNQEPITYTAGDLQLLSALAGQAAQAIENALMHETQVKDAVARNEIEKGQKMQRDFLPDSMLQLKGWELAATFLPARQVAGDFYDTFLLPSGGIGLVIADVCDKGVGSALFMALFRSLIRVFSGDTQLGSISIGHPDAAKTSKAVEINLDHVHALRAVRLTNDYVAQNHSNLNMFATLFFGVLDPVTGVLTYINGGHEPVVIINENGIKTLLKSTGPAVGMLPNMKFRIQQIHLEVGDVLVGYTDGVPEAKSREGKFFTEKKLMALLGEYTQSAQETLDRIEKIVIEHIGGADQFDDITMLAVYRSA
jgi:phosphoserine phosphatase RsbU/P